METARLGNLDSAAFERLGRYNAASWKQTTQTLMLLGSADAGELLSRRVPAEISYRSQPMFNGAEASAASD
jgi:hypothetical protein